MLGNITTDVLVIGGGGAGMRAAIEARRHGVDVTIVSSSRVGYGSNTTISAGGFAAAREGNPNACHQHFQDTVAGGEHLNDQDLVAKLAYGSYPQVSQLYDMGVRYASARDYPWIALPVDPGHSETTTMFYGHNCHGRDFSLPLRQYCLSQGVHLHEGILVTSLLRDKGRVTGAMGLDAGGGAVSISASSVILATGGLGQIYARTDNVAGATGGGYSLAYHADAVLQDMEMVQFYPTSLGNGAPALYYESLFHEAGARLLNSAGEDILSRHGLTGKDDITRDRLSRTIMLEVLQGKGYGDKVLLDTASISRDKIHELEPVLPRGFNKGKRQWLVAPTVHFHMGGASINERAETSLPGLYCAGEASGGVHGANRLSGNALAELWMFGAIAGAEAASAVKGQSHLPQARVDREIERLEQMFPGKDESLNVIRQELKQVMWQKAGVVRDAAGLQQAGDQVSALEERCHDIPVNSGRELMEKVKLASMLTVAQVVVCSALQRTESRGSHYRQDYPHRDDQHWLHHVTVASKDGEVQMGTAPVRTTSMPRTGS